MYKLFELSFVIGVNVHSRHVPEDIIQFVLRCLIEDVSDKLFQLFICQVVLSSDIVFIKVFSQFSPNEHILLFSDHQTTKSCMIYFFLLSDCFPLLLSQNTIFINQLAKQSALRQQLSHQHMQLLSSGPLIFYTRDSIKLSQTSL